MGGRASGYTRGGSSSNFMGNGMNAGQRAFQPQGNAYGNIGRRPPQPPQIENPGLPPYDPNGGAVSSPLQPMPDGWQNSSRGQDSGYSLHPGQMPPMTSPGRGFEGQSPGAVQNLPGSPRQPIGGPLPPYMPGTSGGAVSTPFQSMPMPNGQNGQMMPDWGFQNYNAGTPALLGGGSFWSNGKYIS